MRSRAEFALPLLMEKLIVSDVDLDAAGSLFILPQPVVRPWPTDVAGGS